MQLSILIPITPDRKEMIQPLLAKIGFSIGMFYFIDNGSWVSKMTDDKNEIELILSQDNKELTIGEKRENLYKMATGLYSWQIDSDDSISDNAIQLILEAIKNNSEVDCITFEEAINIDGKIEKSNHSLTYGDWEGQGGNELWDGFHYHRTPFFKSVIKTDIARSVPIPHIRWAEDHQWSQALKSHLHSEIHIDQQLYHYIHKSSNPAERYGLDK